MISIIIPTLNEEKVIEGTLKGLKQTLAMPHEIIVSDGGSRDRTAEISRQYADKVLVYSGEKRQTIAMGRNDGAKAASGEFLAFWDADCSVPDAEAFFRRALAEFEKDPKLVAVTAAIHVLPQYATLADRIIFGIVNLIFVVHNNILHIGNAAGEFQMMRKSAFEAVHGYREDLVAGEDNDLFRRLGRIGHTLVPKGLVIFHTGRRAHKIGWPKLLSQWVMNIFSVAFRNKAHSEEWEEIR